MTSVGGETAIGDAISALLQSPPPHATPSPTHSGPPSSPPPGPTPFDSLGLDGFALHDLSSPPTSHTATPPPPPPPSHGYDDLWDENEGDLADKDGVVGRPAHSLGLHEQVRVELAGMRDSLEASLRAALESEYGGRLALAESRARAAEAEYARAAAEAEEAFQAQLEAEVMRVRADADAERDRVRRRVEEELEDRVAAQIAAIHDQANAKCEAVAAHAQAVAEESYAAQLEAVRAEVRAELRSDVERKMRAALLAKMKVTIRDELRTELEPEIRRGLRADLAVALEKEIREELADREQAVLADRMRSALEAEFRDRLDAAVAKEVADEKAHLEAQAELKIQLKVEERVAAERAKMIAHFKDHQVREAQEAVAAERETIATAHAELARMKSAFKVHRKKRTQELDAREAKIKKLERALEAQKRALEDKISDARTSWMWKEKRLQARAKELEARASAYDGGATPLATARPAVSVAAAARSPSVVVAARSPSVVGGGGGGGDGGLDQSAAFVVGSAVRSVTSAVPSSSVLDDGFDPKAVASQLILKARATYRPEAMSSPLRQAPMSPFRHSANLALSRVAGRDLGSSSLMFESTFAHAPGPQLDLPRLSEGTLARWAEEERAEEAFVNSLPRLDLGSPSEGLVSELYRLWDRCEVSYLRRVAFVSSGPSLGQHMVAAEVARLRELAPLLSRQLALIREWEARRDAQLGQQVLDAIADWEAESGSEFGALKVRGFPARDWMALVSQR